jgi:hypothetical protein
MDVFFSLKYDPSATTSQLHQMHAVRLMEKQTSRPKNPIDVLLKVAVELEKLSLWKASQQVRVNPMLVAESTLGVPYVSCNADSIVLCVVQLANLSQRKKRVLTFGVAVNRGKIIVRM